MVPKKVVPKKNANSANQILKLFGTKIKKNIFIYDAELDHLPEKKINNIARHTSSNILTVFQLKNRLKILLCNFDNPDDKFHQP